MPAKIASMRTIMLLSLSLVAFSIFTSVTTAGTSAVAAEPAGQNDSDLSKLNVSLDTKGFAKTTQREIVKPEPSEPGDEIVMLNGLPKCLRLTFDNEKMKFYNAYDERHLFVFSLNKYAALYKDAERKHVFEQRLRVIKKIITSGSDRGVSDIPIFPETDAGQTFHNQLRSVKFKQGSGFSFISRISNGDPPLSNDDQFYCFEGLSNDGKYLVVFSTHIKSSGMKPNLSIDKGVAYLAKLPRNKFTPDLDTLDRMMQTLDIK